MQREDELNCRQGKEYVPVHGVNKRQSAENIWIPERHAVICLDELGVKAPKEKAGLDIVRAEEHFIGEDEIGEQKDGQKAEKEVGPFLVEKFTDDHRKSPPFDSRPESNPTPGPAKDLSNGGNPA